MQIILIKGKHKRMIKRESLFALGSRFLISGGIATIAHWGLMWWLILNGTHAILATAIGATLGAITNYLLQYYHTFRCTNQHTTTFIAYLITCLFTWIANILVFTILFKLLIHQPMIAQFLTTALMTIINFYLYKKIIFS